MPAMSPWIVTPLLIVAVGVVLVTALLRVMAVMLLRPPRMSDGRAMAILSRLTPEDIGLPYQSVTFHARDERTGEPLDLAAWWIPAEAKSDRTVVLIHGYGDAKVGGIAWAPVWRELGFHCLAIDLRAHGESGGRDSTAGYWERHDVNAVLNDLRAARPESTRHVALFGVSLGAAVAVATAQARDDLLGVVLDSPYPRYRDAIVAHATLMRMPLDRYRPLAVRWAERMSGADFERVRPTDLISSCPCPVLLIQGDNDPFVPPPDRQKLRDAFAKRGDSFRGVDEEWTVLEAWHCMAVALDPDAYVARLRGFIERAVSRRDGRSHPERTDSHVTAPQPVTPTSATAARRPGRGGRGAARW
jgi:pimeloyl-ACP methyl ester carboxylesterase